MKKHRTTLIVMCVLGVLAVWAIAEETPSPTPDAQPKIRVGTFNSRIVALAYSRSYIFKDIVSGLNARAEKAQADGNQKQADQLILRAKSMQQRASMQVFGQLPVDNILSHIKGIFPRLAKDANVELIAQKVHYQSPSVEIVDVTDTLILVFRPDEETLKAIESLKKQLSSGASRMPSNHPPVNAK